MNTVIYNHTGIPIYLIADQDTYKNKVTLYIYKAKPEKKPKKESPGNVMAEEWLRGANESLRAKNWPEKSNLNIVSYAKGVRVKVKTVEAQGKTTMIMTLTFPN